MLIHALRLLRREIASGELRLLLAALIIGVASPASVSFFADRMERALNEQKAEWLGGNLLVSSSRPIPLKWFSLAGDAGLAHTETLNFRSVVMSGNNMTLTEVKAVTTGYPLMGGLSISFDSDEPQIVEGLPAEDEVWVEKMLLHKLAIKIGDSLTLGALELKVTGMIHHEPDRAVEMFTLAPRIMVNRKIIPASGLIQPGSRVKYRLSLVGDESQITDFYQQLEPLLAQGDQLIRDPEETSQSGAAMKRAEKFLRLVSLTGFILAAVAVGMSAHRFALRHVRVSSIYRCLGASSRWVLGVYSIQLLLLGLVGSLLGGLLGYFAQFGLERILGELLTIDLPPPGISPLISSVLTGLVVTIGFGFAPLYAMRNLRPAQILRDETPNVDFSRLLLYLPPIVALVSIMVVQTGELSLTLLMVGGIGLTVGFLVLGTVLMIRIARSLDTKGNLVHRFALLGITRRPTISVLQVASVGVGLMVLLLLSVVSRELLESWKNDVPADAPNHFAINIRAEQIAGIQQFFRQHGMTAPVVYPMVRGRLIKINDRQVVADDYTKPRAQRLLKREFNLSWTDKLNHANRITAGEKWQDAKPADRWSVEEGIAKLLGIKVGDNLTFEISGRAVKGQVVNLRHVSWDSFQVNFFVIAAPGMLDTQQASYITAFHLPADSEHLLLELIKRYPNITEFNVEAILLQVRTIIEQVTRSVEFISLFTLAAGFLVLIAAVRTSMDERQHENAILRVLGASRAEIQLALILEFSLLGLFTGLLAALGAWLAGAILADQAFNTSFGFYSILWLAGPAGGIIGMVSAGLWATREVVKVSPMRVIGSMS